jgi:hypothetical protein
MRTWFLPWKWPLPSFDRPLKAEARRLKILTDCPYVNREGGIGYNNPDLKWLRQKGFVKIIREDHGTTFTGLPRNFSKVVRTPAGIAAFKKGGFN